MYSSFPIHDDKFEESDLEGEFVSFLTSLKQQDINTFVNLVNLLCLPTACPCFSIEDAPNIETQHLTENRKRPDILIKSANILCALELKFWSDTKERQKADYRWFLDNSSEASPYGTKSLSFLTPLPIPPDQRIDKNPTWADILRFLEKITTTNSKIMSLVSQFRKFLEEVGLDDQDPDSILIEMVRQAVEDVYGKNFVSKGCGIGEDKWAPYTGFYIRDEFRKEFWCGITHNFPSLIRLNTDEGTKYKYIYSDKTRDLIKTNLPYFQKNYFITKFGPQMDIPNKWGHISFLFHMDHRFCSLGNKAKQAEIHKFIKIASENMKRFKC